MSAGGPLTGLRVVEVAGIGPAPFGAMLLADLGADVIRVDRPGGHAGNPVPPHLDFMNRGRRSIDLNLKDPADLEVARALIADADVLIEGYRPGVTERLGIGPDECLAANPRLVYARMTGWGQDGPLAHAAGHDINYIARAGALDPIGPDGGPPVIPLNLIGDFGGGGMYLAFGILAAVHHATRTGEGQVLDVAITDGVALLAIMHHVWRAAGLWKDERATNMLDGGAHFYGVYETADGEYLAIGAIEPPFYAALLHGLGQPLEGDWLAAHEDRALWPRMRDRVATLIREHDLAHWLAVYDGTDACVAPVLSAAQAGSDPHNLVRGTFVHVGDTVQPAPGPRFSATPAPAPAAHPRPGEHADEIRHAVARGTIWSGGR